MDRCNNMVRMGSCRIFRQHQYLCESLQRRFFLVQGIRKGFYPLFADMLVERGLQCSSWLSLLFWFLYSVPLRLIEVCFYPHSFLFFIGISCYDAELELLLLVFMNGNLLVIVHHSLLDLKQGRLTR
jgi:hypothetical protein